MKQTRYTVTVCNAAEAYLIALLASSLDWIISPYNTGPEVWQHYPHLQLSLENRTLIGYSTPRSGRVTSVELPEFIRLIRETPKLITVQLNEDIKAVVAFDGSEVYAEGFRFPAQEVLDFAAKLTPAPENQNRKSRFSVINLVNENEIRLAAAALRAAGWVGANPSYYDSFTMHRWLVIDHLDIRFWGQEDEPNGAFPRIGLDELLVIVHKGEPAPLHSQDIAGGNYTASILHDGQFVIIGCQSFSSNVFIELAKHVKVPEPIPAKPNAPAAPAGDIHIHNPDGLSEEEYGKAEGYRLLDVDERGTQFSGGVGVKAIQSLDDGRGSSWDTSDHVGNSDRLTYRTKLTREQLAGVRNGTLPNEKVPATPAAPVLGNENNPLNLTPEQVGVSEGYRLLDIDEVGKAFTNGRLIEELQCAYGNPPMWDNGPNVGNAIGASYRTKLTRDQLAAVRRGEVAQGIPDPVF